MAEPWRVVRIYSNGCEVCPRIMAGQKVIAEVYGAPYLGFTDTLPNAYRMAASLELAEALDALLCRIAVNGHDVGIISDGYTIRAINKALAVIAKATGEKSA
jgi:hypothetical protein